MVKNDIDIYFALFNHNGEAKLQFNFGVSDYDIWRNFWKSPLISFLGDSWQKIDNN